MKSLLALMLAVSWATLAAAQNMTSSFQPWTVEGPVNTAATGTATLGWTGETVSYNVTLFNIFGIHAIELHVGERGLHGQVASVLYAAAFDNMDAVNGLAAAGTLADHDLLGPFLLPCGNHLPPSILYEDYIELGYAFVVVHTMANMGGEVVAYFNGTNADPSNDMAEFMANDMSMGTAPSMAPAMSSGMGMMMPSSSRP